MEAPKRPKTARQRAYAEVVAVAREGLATYYRQHQDRLGDERAADAIRESTQGVALIIAVLDKYEITDREES